MSDHAAGLVLVAYLLRSLFHPHLPKSFSEKQTLSISQVKRVLVHIASYLWTDQPCFARWFFARTSSAECSRRIEKFAIFPTLKGSQSAGMQLWGSLRRFLRRLMRIFQTRGRKQRRTLKQMHADLMAPTAGLRRLRGTGGPIGSEISRRQGAEGPQTLRGLIGRRTASGSAQCSAQRARLQGLGQMGATGKAHPLHRLTLARVRRGGKQGTQ